tara:strand:+ start:52696 stop:53619 length:924 start_codon:yes stop_codon:yes gene_type:complete
VSNCSLAKAAGNMFVNLINKTGLQTMLNYIWHPSRQEKEIKETELQDFTGHSRDYQDQDSNSLDISDFEIIPDDDIISAMPNAEDREVLRELRNTLAKIDLAKIESEDALVDFIVNFASDRGKTINRQGIRDYFKATGLELDKLLSDAKSGQYTKSEIAMRIGLTIAGVVAVHWFAGPAAAVAARSIYSGAYGTIWGIPSAWNPLYWAAYLPGREHFGHLAYNWAPWMINTAGVWAYNKTVDAAKYTSNTVLNAYQWAVQTEKSSEDKPDIVSDHRDTYIDTDFAALNEQMDSLSLDEKPRLFTNKV